MVFDFVDFASWGITSASTTTGLILTDSYSWAARRLGDTPLLSFLRLRFSESLELGMKAPVIVVKCNSKPTSAEDKCNESRSKHGRLRISLVKLIPFGTIRWNKYEVTSQERGGAASVTWGRSIHTSRRCPPGGSENIPASPAVIFEAKISAPIKSSICWNFYPGGLASAPPSPANRVCPLRPTGSSRRTPPNMQPAYNSLALALLNIFPPVHS